LAVPVRGRAAADRGRHGIPAQPDRHFLEGQMLHLRIYGPSGAMEDVGQGLERGGDARHVTLVPAVRPGHALLTAEVAPEAADQVLEYLLRRGLAQEDVALARLDEIGPIAKGALGTGLIWADGLGQARRNARAVARYLVFMTVAGVF